MDESRTVVRASCGTSGKSLVKQNPQQVEQAQIPRKIGLPPWPGSPERSSQRLPWLVLAYIWAVYRRVPATRALGVSSNWNVPRLATVWMILLTGWVGGVYFPAQDPAGPRGYPDRITPRPAERPTPLQQRCRDDWTLRFDPRGGPPSSSPAHRRSSRQAALHLGSRACLDELCHSARLVLAPRRSEPARARRDWTRADELADAVFEVERACAAVRTSPCGGNVRRIAFALKAQPDWLSTETKRTVVQGPHVGLRQVPIVKQNPPTR